MLPDVADVHCLRVRACNGASLPHQANMCTLVCMHAIVYTCVHVFIQASHATASRSPKYLRLLQKRPSARKEPRTEGELQHEGFGYMETEA